MSGRPERLQERAWSTGAVSDCIAVSVPPAAKRGAVLDLQAYPEGLPRRNDDGGNAERYARNLDPEDLAMAWATRFISGVIPKSRS